MDAPRADQRLGNPLLQRFSSRQGRLAHVFLKDRLAGARAYRRIAGYFRSSIFELVSEEIAGIDTIQIVCNSDLDPRDIAIGKASRVPACTALRPARRLPTYSARWM